MRNAILAGLGILLVCSGGCMKLVRGDFQEVEFKTDPAGALVKVDSQEITTPSKLKLTRKDPHEVTISKAGYRTVKFRYVAQWDGTSLPEFALPGGSALMAADVASGADRSFHKLETIKLEPTSDASSPPLERYHFRGKLYTEEGLREAVKEERQAHDMHAG